ncbi:MAG: dockerin type I domain-containing protein [Verrucomicrobiota bacterium]|nr:dockerin type I domain-containing protein [Verrucomicrobiota bacterium]
MLRFETLLRRSAVLLACLVGHGISCPLARATEVVPLTLSETIRQADTIVLGHVVSQTTRWGNDSHRWMLTDYTFAVDGSVYTSGKAGLPGKTITVTYWGGILDGETQAISDIRLPVVGERLLLMLKDGWKSQVNFSPVVGLNYGLLKVVRDGAGDTEIVLDANGSPLTKGSNGGFAWKGAASKTDAVSDKVDLGTFLSWLRASIGAIKNAPTELPPHVDRNDPRVMKVFANAPYVPSRLDRPPAAATGIRPAVEQGGQTPEPKADQSAMQQEGAPNEQIGPATEGGIAPRYSYPRVANLPITVNNFQSTFTPWSPEDQYQLSKWNYYADVFRVYASPTGNWAWQNDRFDLCGFPSSADMQSQFGAPWDANTIGICYTRWNSSNTIIEGDIALNPAWGFTLDDEWVNDGSSARSFRQVLSHELGHMWGLAHQFNFLSIMNDSQSVFRFFAFPYMDDAEGIRAAYPSVAVTRTDLAVYLRYSSGTQSITDATYPANATAGGTLTVNNYHVENVGTATIATPTIEWYLTTARNYSSSYYFIGTSTYGSLGRFTYFTPSTTSRTFNIPASVPGGLYYLNAFIRNDAGATQGSYPFGNNYAFSRTQITLAGATYTVSPSAGSNGSIAPSAAQTVGYNGSRLFTATPTAGYIVNQWLIDGTAVQTGGTSYNVANVTANHTVQVTFKRALTAVVSRKSHLNGGTFDLALPLTGAAAVEARQTGTAHTLVFTFSNTLNSVGSATVSQGTGTASSFAIGSDTHQCIVNLTGVSNAQVLTVTLGNTADTFGNVATVSISMAVLVGDTNGDGAVNSADASETRARSGQTLTAANFMSDVNADGFINTADTTIVQARSGNGLP